MAVYALGDLHLSFYKEKSMDIFGGNWSGHAEKIRECWLAAVTPEDTVVLPGDTSWAMNFEELLPDFAFLDSLPGRKLIGKGNHDYWWNTLKKLREFTAQNGFCSIDFLHNNAYECGGLALCGTRGWNFEGAKGGDREFDAKIIRREVERLRFSLEAGRSSGGRPVVFLHYPPVYEGIECAEILEVLLSYGVKDCYYGHLHGAAAKKAVTGLYRGIRFYLVSCDSVGFCPVPVADGV